MSARAAVVTALAPVALLTACIGSNPDTSPPPIVGKSVRPISACPSSVTVPAARVQVVPKADVPPTSVVKVGDAIVFTADGKVGFAGLEAAAETRTVCRASGGSATQVVLVARAPGYVRIAIQPTGKGRTPVLLIKVSS